MAGSETLGRLALSFLLLTGAGCESIVTGLDRLADRIDGAEEEASPETIPEREVSDAGEAEPPSPKAARPTDSIARSETEVIAFRSILDDPELSREERVEALLKLGPAALQNPGGPGSSTGMDRGRRRPQSQKPSDWELAASRRRVPVVMYSTSWCHVCDSARNYLESNRISFVEHDVDRDARARAEYLRLNPRRSVPTIQVGEELIVGFSPGSLEGALDRAARARLR